MTFLKKLHSYLKKLTLDICQSLAVTGGFCFAFVPFCGLDLFYSSECSGVF